MDVSYHTIMKSPGSPAWRKAGRPSTMPVQPEDDNEPLTPEELEIIEQCETPEQVAKVVSTEALETIIRIMRRPGRHAQTQLAAARELMAYGMSKPVAKTELTGANGGPVESRHEIVFVKPGGKE